MGSALRPTAQRIIGRYALYEEIASGGMAAVHLGRMMGQAGFARTVAVKRLHPQFAKDPNFVEMFLDEARLAVRVQHPNVVAPLDIVIINEELFLVMEYVAGETLSRLSRSPLVEQEGIKPSIVASILVGSLYGLHAAHEAVSEGGRPLAIVHRDVSPQNVMVGLDGIARVLDFGVAKAAMRSHATTEGQIKGKLAYMAPEQVENGSIDRRTDVFAAGVVLWEALTGHRLFHAEQPSGALLKVLKAPILPPSVLNPAIKPELDCVVLRALERGPEQRFQSAREFARELERVILPASASEVGDWVRRIGGAELTRRTERVAAIENHSSTVAVGRPGPRRRTPPQFAAIRQPESTADLTPAEAAAATPPSVTVVTAFDPVQPKRVEEDARPGSPATAGQTPARPETVQANSMSQSVVLVARDSDLQVAGRARSRLPLAIGASVALGGGLLVAGFSVMEVNHSALDAEHAASPAARPQVSSGASSMAQARVRAMNGAEPRALAGEQGELPAPENTPDAGRSGQARTDSGSRPWAAATASRPKLAATRVSGTAARPQSQSSEAKKATCNPPYYLDGKGIRRLRPECD